VRTDGVRWMLTSLDEPLHTTIGSGTSRIAGTERPWPHAFRVNLEPEVSGARGKAWDRGAAGSRNRACVSIRSGSVKRPRGMHAQRRHRQPKAVVGRGMTLATARLGRRSVWCGEDMRGRSHRPAGAARSAPRLSQLGIDPSGGGLRWVLGTMAAEERARAGL
jgi:hypothetical protein